MKSEFNYQKKCLYPAFSASTKARQDKVYPEYHEEEDEQEESYYNMEKVEASPRKYWRDEESQQNLTIQWRRRRDTHFEQSKHHNYTHKGYKQGHQHYGKSHAFREEDYKQTDSNHV
jgi:hypothetical protein